MKEVVGVSKSKYASVDEAVKWSVNVLKAALKETWRDYSEQTSRMGGMSILDVKGLREFTANKENNFEIFAERLENNLVGELDKKIMSNMLNEKKALQRIRNLRKKKRDANYDSIDLENVYDSTIRELGFTSNLSRGVMNESKLTPTRFVGKSFFDELDVTYDFGQKPMNVTKTPQKSILKMF